MGTEPQFGWSFPVCSVVSLDCEILRRWFSKFLHESLSDDKDEVHGRTGTSADNSLPLHKAHTPV